MLQHYKALDSKAAHPNQAIKSELTGKTKYQKTQSAPICRAQTLWKNFTRPLRAGFRSFQGVSAPTSCRILSLSISLFGFQFQGLKMKRDTAVKDQKVALPSGARNRSEVAIQKTWIIEVLILDTSIEAPMIPIWIKAGQVQPHA